MWASLVPSTWACPKKEPFPSFWLSPAFKSSLIFEGRGGVWVIPGSVQWPIWCKELNQAIKAAFITWVSLSSPDFYFIFEGWVLPHGTGHPRRINCQERGVLIKYLLLPSRDRHAVCSKGVPGRATQEEGRCPEHGQLQRAGAADQHLQRRLRGMGLLVPSPPVSCTVSAHRKGQLDTTTGSSCLELFLTY